MGLLKPLPSLDAFPAAQPRPVRLGSLTLDPDALARAEAALKSLSAQMDGWMEDELVRLDAERAAVAAEGLAGPAGEALYSHAHDLKGLGTTYGYPLVTRIAGSLCKLIDTPAKRAAEPLASALAHIDAMTTIAREGLKDQDDPAGLALAEAVAG